MIKLAREGLNHRVFTGARGPMEQQDGSCLPTLSHLQELSNLLLVDCQFLYCLWRVSIDPEFPVVPALLGWGYARLWLVFSCDLVKGSLLGLLGAERAACEGGVA